MPNNDERARIESKAEVQGYIQNLIYALDHGAHIDFQPVRAVDSTRDTKYSNAYTVADLFPDEDPITALGREIRKLKVEEYIRTVKDLKHPKRSEYREFGRVFPEKGDVYIKIRVEVINYYGGQTVFVMSFHYAVKPLANEYFPYAKKQGEGENEDPRN